MIKFKKSLAVMMLSAALITAASCAKGNNEGGGTTPTQDIIDPFLEGTDVFIGDTVTITPREIEKDGKYYPCYDFYTITPDGNRLSGDKQYISVAGQYETVFMAKMDDGSFITDSDTFIAYERAFSVEKEASSTQYVNEVKGDFEHTTPGITATLTEGDTWHYNQIVDISGSSLAKPIIKFYSSPMSEFINGDVSPFIDATKQILRISDYYDPTNYIDVQIGYFLANQGTGRMQTYSVAGSADQTATGLMEGNHVWGTRRLVNLDGLDYTCCFGFDEFGATMNTVPGTWSYKDPEHTKPFNPDITNSDRYGYSVYYVESTKRIYIQHRDLIFITDLDESKIYNDNVFRGFTTGEVNLSLRFDAYKSSSATFEITEIYGKTGEDLKEERALDNKAPEIYVDCPETNFYVARNEEFSAPLATAMDAHLKGDVQTEVIYDKGSSGERYIPLVDGKFTPTEIGEYTIVYTARDAFENVSTKEIKCLSINCTDDKLVNFDYEKVTETDAGTPITINKPTISSPNGKGLYANLYIVDPIGGQTKFDALKEDSVSYLLKRVGKYKVIYEYGDVAKSYVEEYEFNSKASENVYLDSTIFPTYFIKGSKVSLDDNKAVLCDSASIHYVNATLEVSADGGAYTPISDINNFEVVASSTLKFKYSYEGELIYESATIPVIDVNFKDSIDLTKYFASQSGWIKTLNSQSIELRSTSANTLDFINSLSFSSFATKFKFYKRDQFDKFSLILTDYYDSTNVLNLDFTYRLDSLYLTVNDDLSVSLGDTDSVNISYDYVSSTFYYGNSYFHLDNPFTNDRYYLSFKFDNPKSDAAIILSTIHNQNFKEGLTIDNVRPEVAWNNITGYYSMGSTIKINKTYVDDVLSPYLKANHQLLVEYQTDVDADPEVVKSIEGVSLDGTEDADKDYHIALSKYGIYTLTYSYEDQFKKFNYSQDVVYSVDDKAPVITIEGATTSTVDTCGLNADVKVRNFTVQDESECMVTIYAVSPSGVINKVNNNTFKANQKGLWKVIYYAVDAIGNVGSTYYQVECK